MDVELGTALRAAGLRVTAPRLAALEALGEHPHSTAETLRVAFAAGLSIQSVHTVLADLAAARMIRRIGDNHHHHHLIRTLCSVVADVDCVKGPALCLAPHDTSGFDGSVAEVTFRGLCASGQTRPIASELPTIKEIVP